MTGLASPWILGTSALSSSSSTTSSSLFSDSWKISRTHHFFSSSYTGGPLIRSQSSMAPSAPIDLKFLLHDVLDSSGVNTTHARAAREGFCSQIKKLSIIERETSISINREIDLGTTALYIAAEDDSLISHSSVPLPVEAFVERLDDLSMGYCALYSSSLRSSPENFLECLERYMYVDKGFRRTYSKKQVEQRALYLNSVLTHRVGSASMLSLIYSEILKMLRLWGLLNFDVEIFFPHDSHGSPRGYLKQKSKESDQPHIMTSELLLVKILKDLKKAFWPFQVDRSGSLFLRAAEAANCSDSGLELASAKAARHRLERGVWTSVRFGDIRRSLSACERLIILATDSKELRDYSVLLYHCGFYEESLQYLELYQETEKSSSLKQPPDSLTELEEDAEEKLMIRLKLILMDGGYSRPSSIGSFLYKNTEPCQTRDNSTTWDQILAQRSTEEWE